MGDESSSDKDVIVRLDIATSMLRDALAESRGTRPERRARWKYAVRFSDSHRGPLKSLAIDLWVGAARIILNRPILYAGDTITVSDVRTRSIVSRRSTSDLVPGESISTVYLEIRSDLDRLSEDEFRIKWITAATGRNPS